MVAAAEARAKQAVQAHNNWTKQSSPGASIQAKESSRHPDAVQYRLFVTGLPTDSLYTAWSWPVNSQPQQVMEGITIGKDGVLSCAGKTPEQCTSPNPGGNDDAIDFTFYPQKGEPYRLAFISQHDPQTRVAIVLVPKPIEGRDKGCTLNAIRLTPKFELSYITATGFAPNTDLSFDTRSWDEKHLIPGRTDAEGKTDLMMLNGVVGHDRGTTTVKVIGTQCSPSLRFDWGPVNLNAGQKQ